MPLLPGPDQDLADKLLGGGIIMVELGQGDAVTYFTFGTTQQFVEIWCHCRLEAVALASQASVPGIVQLGIAQLSPNRPGHLTLD
jgi:hypothetical protein